MLSDLQKIQTNLHVFFTKFGENQTDPEAGQARPENLLIMNDPDFVPDVMLPKFDLDALLANSQATNKTSSQMSPLDSLLSGSQTPGTGFNIQLDWRGSESSGPRGSPFGLQGLSSSQKPEGGHMVLPPEKDRQEDVFVEEGDWGMEIDEDGNIVEAQQPVIVQDDLDLPPFPTIEGEDQAVAGPHQKDQPIMDDQAVVTAPRDNHSAFQSDDHPRRQAPSRRKRNPRPLLADTETQLPRATINKWQEEYKDNCGIKFSVGGPAVAKANAMHLMFGRGLWNVAEIPGLIKPHNLAREFSGDALFTAITGIDLPERSRGRRRAASESAADDQDEQGRRVRPRHSSEGVQLGRDLESDNVFGAVDPSSPEVGREAQQPMSDHLSSALRMPWNRGSSALPLSSLHGSAQKGRVPSSPLATHGNVDDVMRFSEGPSLGSDGIGFGGARDDSFDGFNLPAEGAEEEEAKDKWPALGVEGANFMAFVESTVRDNGERRRDEDFDVDRRWVAFDDVFVPKQTPRDIAAQAFFHTLTLATQGQLEVQQDSDPGQVFGGIWVGMRMGGLAPAAAAV
ncbi:hypothetical protein F4804DRAFT_348019 [Jackrogersella minutella]|nr:hypothetical protein F4804DRAFT_348019 [Jackrogersella minutella]